MVWCPRWIARTRSPGPYARSRAALAWLSILVVAILAGCVGTDPPAPKTAGPLQDDEAKVTDVPDGLGDSLIATALNATSESDDAGDWFILPAAAGPDRPLVAYNWTVPEGSLQPLWWDEARSVVAIEALPLVRDGDEDALDQFTFQVFLIREGGADHILGHVAGVWNGVSESFSGAQPIDPEDQPLYPWWMGIQAPDLAAGHRLAFVIGAQAASPIEFAVAFRVMDEQPRTGEGSPSTNMTEFLDAVSGRPLALAPSGSGAGYSYGFYMDLGTIVLDPALGVPSDFVSMELWTDEAVWSNRVPGAVDATRPYVSARDLTLSFSHDVPRGWGFGWGFAMVSGGSGTWELDAAVHGQRAAGNGVLGSWALAIAAGPAYQDVGMLASYEAEGEGEGGNSATFRVTYADGGFTYMAAYEHLDFAVTLAELLGTPGVTYVAMSGMEQDAEPPLDRMPEHARDVMDTFAPHMGHGA